MRTEHFRPQLACAPVPKIEPVESGLSHRATGGILHAMLLYSIAVELENDSWAGRPYSIHDMSSTEGEYFIPERCRTGSKAKTAAPFVFDHDHL